MPDFETHPIGTADRLKALEAENARLREALVDVTHFAYRNGMDIARAALADKEDAERQRAERVTQLEADNARLREALEKIVALENDFESNAAMTAHEWQMFHTACAALATTEDAERQRAERNAHIKAQISRVLSFMTDAEERN
jgi:hypothetical protein